MRMQKINSAHLQILIVCKFFEIEGSVKLVHNASKETEREEFMWRK